MKPVHNYFTSNIPKDIKATTLYPYIGALCRRAQVHWKIALNALLGAINQPVSSSVNVETAFGEKPSSLYLICAGAHSDGKTNAYGLANQGTKKYFSAKLREHGRQYKEYNERKDQYEIALKDWKNNQGMGLKKPIPPIYPYIITKNFTIAGSYRALSEGFPHLAFSTTEAASMFGGHIYKTENRLSTAAFLSSVWDGEDLDNLRKDSPMSIAVGKRFSIDAFCQPAILNPFLKDELLKEQGVLARFLMLQGGDIQKYKTYISSKPNKDDKQAQKDIELLEEFNTKIEKLWQEIKYIDNDPTEGVKFRNVEISEEAQENLLPDFYEFIQESHSPDHEYYEINDFMYRGINHVERLAVNIGCFRNPYCSSASKKDVLDSITLFNYFAEDTFKMRIGSNLKSNNKLDSDTYKFMKFKEYILKKPKEQRESFKRRELQRGIFLLRDKDKLNDLLTLLYDHKFIEKDKDNSSVYHLTDDINAMVLTQTNVDKKDYLRFNVEEYRKKEEYYNSFDSKNIKQTIEYEKEQLNKTNALDLSKNLDLIKNDEFFELPEYKIKKFVTKLLKLPKVYQEYFTNQIQFYQKMEFILPFQINAIKNLKFFLSNQAKISFFQIISENFKFDIWQEEINNLVYCNDAIRHILSITEYKIEYLNEDEEFKTFYAINNDNNEENDNNENYNNL